MNGSRSIMIFAFLLFSTSPTQSDTCQRLDFPTHHQIKKETAQLSINPAPTKKKAKLNSIRTTPPHHLPPLPHLNPRKLLLRHLRPRNPQRPLYRLPLPDAVMPSLHRRPVREIEAQEVRRDAHPREAGDVGNGELLAGQVGRLSEAGFEDGVEALRLVGVAPDAPVGADGGESGEVVGLACFLA